jgi:hypothetical protein
MDPYLEEEKVWPQFHHLFLSCLHQILVPSLVDRYRARLGQRQYATEMALFTSIVRQEHNEEYLEVRQRSDSKLVTLIDVVSPANKLTPAGRKAYLACREEAKQNRASLVEIDLVIQGQPTLDFSREGLPDWDYAVTVTRSTQPERFEIYTATLQKRLPRFRLPLAADDRDTVVDLQAAFARCYDQSNLANLVDYRRDPAIGLADDDREWLASHLKQCKKR